MMDGWEKVALGNVLKKIIGGGTPSKSKDEYWNGNVLWCSVKDMQDDKFHLSDTVDRITELGLKNSSANLISKGTVVTATRMGLGRAFIAGNDMAINQDLKALIPNDKIDNDFLLWTIVVNRSHLENLGTGSTVKGIRLETLRNLKINLPPLNTQRKIARILSAYDDLIENNLKRITLLEEQAQLMYEEWFVRFKFPGHETAKFNEDTGLPEGWEKVRLTEVVKMKFGYAFKANQFNSDGLGKPIIRIRNIPSSSTKDFTTEIVDKKYIVKQGDLLIGMDGEFYVNNWSGPEGYLVQRVCCITSNKEEYKGLITEAIRQPIRVFQASIDGATVAHLGKKHLDQISIIIPKDLNIEFFTYLLNEKINLSNQNQLLKEARDILLPRLMSGVIDVEKLEVGSAAYEKEERLGMVAEDRSVYEKDKVEIDSLFNTLNYDFEIAVVVLLTRQILNRNYGKKYIHKMFSNIKFLEALPVFKDLEFQENHWGMYCPVIEKTIGNQKYIRFENIDDERSVLNFDYKFIKEVTNWMNQDDYAKKFVVQVKNMLSIYQKSLIRMDMDRIELFNTVLECMSVLETNKFDAIRHKMENWKMQEEGYKTKAEKFKPRETELMINLIEDLK